VSGIVAVALLVAVAAVVRPGGGGAASTASVAYVIDGDTIVLGGGSRVRLLQIDSPELRGGECYSHRSAAELRRLLPVGTRVQLLADPRLDRVDRYGRLLRYVYRGTTNVNVALVSRGAATVWFSARERGRFATRLLQAARRARAEGRGRWGACRAVWNPYGPAQTRPR
jgi:endonuclease YncB( thermonuclease family)